MMTHIVLLKVRRDVAQSEVERVFAALIALKAKIHGLLDVRSQSAAVLRAPGISIGTELW